MINYISPSINVEIEFFSLVKLFEVGCHLCLLQHIVVHTLQSFDQLNARVVPASDKCCFGHLKV